MFTAKIKAFVEISRKEYNKNIQNLACTDFYRLQLLQFGKKVSDSVSIIVLTNTSTLQNQHFKINIFSNKNLKKNLFFNRNLMHIFIIDIHRKLKR